MGVGLPNYTRLARRRCQQNCCDVLSGARRDQPSSKSERQTRAVLPFRANLSAGMAASCWARIEVFFVMPMSARVGGAPGNGSLLEPLVPPPTLCSGPRFGIAPSNSPRRRSACRSNTFKISKPSMTDRPANGAVEQMSQCAGATEVSPQGPSPAFRTRRDGLVGVCKLFSTPCLETAQTYAQSHACTELNI